jgi:iron complex transport system ATP-binding protein
MKTDFVELKNVSVIRGERKILDGINLTVSGTENAAIIGPNGSGKSTFIKLITGKIYPSYTGGATVCRLFGNERWNVADLRSRLGIVTNELQYDFHGGITGFEAVLSGFFASIGLFNNHTVTEDMKNKAAETIELLDVAHLKDKELGTMSSGEARRFLIARALVNDPEVLVLDEPSNSLDVASAVKLHATMRKINSAGAKIVLVTHLASDIIPEIGRFIYFKDGKIFADGTRKEIFNGAELSRLFGMKVNLTEKDGLCWLNG